MIRAIAIDDEPLALEVIKNFSVKIDFLSLEGTFHTQMNALLHLKKFPVDLIFLDIEMPNKNGFELYASIQQQAKVIFTTAYSDYAVKAFEVNAIDYLVKPFSFERFKAAVEKAQQALPAVNKESFFVRANQKLQKVFLDDILMIEALDDYIQIHLQDKSKIVVRHTMKELLEKLPANKFTRVHRSFILPNDKITTVVNKCIRVDDFVIPIGDSYKDKIIRMI